MCSKHKHYVEKTYTMYVQYFAQQKNADPAGLFNLQV
jgi:hypothetical protein